MLALHPTRLPGAAAPGNLLEKPILVRSLPAPMSGLVGWHMIVPHQLLGDGFPEWSRRRTAINGLLRPIQLDQDNKLRVRRGNEARQRSLCLTRRDTLCRRRAGLGRDAVPGELGRLGIPLGSEMLKHSRQQLRRLRTDYPPLRLRLRRRDMPVIVKRGYQVGM